MKTYRFITSNDTQKFEDRVNESAARGWVVVEYRCVVTISTPLYTALMERDA